MSRSHRATVRADQVRAADGAAPRRGAGSAIEAARDAYAAAVTPTPAQRRALNDYTGGYAVGINDRLRHGPCWVNDWAEDYIRDLDALMTRWRTPAELRAVRGVHTDAVPGRTRRGQVIADPGYQSAQLGDRAARGYASHPVQLHITIPAGLHAVVVTATTISTAPDEDEIVLPRGTRYRIDTDTRTGTRTGGDGRRHLSVTAMPPASRPSPATRAAPATPARPTRSRTPNASGTSSARALTFRVG